MTQMLIIALIGVGLFLYGLLQFRRVKASQSWPYTPGRILTAKVERSVSTGNQDEADTVSYSPAIEYEYLVNNQRFVGNRIAFVGKGYSSPKKAEEVLRAFQVGAWVWVFYDPAKPQEAVLEKKASGGTLMMALGGAVLILAIVAAFRK